MKDGDELIYYINHRKELDMVCGTDKDWQTWQFNNDHHLDRPFTHFSIWLDEFRGWYSYSFVCSYAGATQNEPIQFRNLN